MDKHSEFRGAEISPDFYASLGLGLDTHQGVVYRAVQQLIEVHCSHMREALDVGSGTGRSANLLHEIGFEKVKGVDINPDMIAKATETNTAGIQYELVENGKLPFENEQFDLAFSGIVLLEIPDPGSIQKTINEMKRVTRNDGSVIVLTCAKEGYLLDSDKFRCVLPAEQRENLQDGDPVPTEVIENGHIFTDYYWSDDFYRRTFETAGLEVVKTMLPTAAMIEGAQISDEQKDTAFYVIYVCKKSST